MQSLLSPWFHRGGKTFL